MSPQPAPRDPIARTAPRSPSLHLFETESGGHAFIPNGSQLYDVSPETYATLGTALLEGESAVVRALSELLPPSAPFVDDAPLAPPPLRTLSLNVVQSCNLACGYCYAAGGGFGGPALHMSWEVARRAIEGLIGGAAAGERVHLAYLGGEPLINRALIRRATTWARDLGRERGVGTSFAVTTNGTLLEEGDADFFEEHAFAVTVSLDGAAAVHDALRPFRSGTGSFERIMSRVAPLLRVQDRMQVSARVTVTPRNLQLRETLVDLAARGFRSIGFSPMLSSPSGALQMEPADLTELLTQMVACGREFERALLSGQHHPFANLATALQEIHRGTHRPYPCGAGAGYLSLSAAGEYFACHRFVEDRRAAMGSLEKGIDNAQRVIWLEQRHVHRQDPCGGCWARYLCGGGCHHEVMNRGRVACDYIRGWLQYCLDAYVRLSAGCPDYFGARA